LCANILHLGLRFSRTMVEVVQDLLDHVTYAGGVGRRRADAVSGLGAGTPKPGFNDCAVVGEDPDDPRGPRIVALQEIIFQEMLDKPLHEKEYHLQLDEFAFRGERLVEQLDQKLAEVDRLVKHDVLWRSKRLHGLLAAVCEQLRRAQVLICQELLEVWHIKFEPFFYPSDVEPLPGATVGGWLDLDDVFLTVKMLVRHVSEIVSLVRDLIKEVPMKEDARTKLRNGRPTPPIEAIVKSCAAHVPWLGVSVMRGDIEEDAGAGELVDLPLSQAITALDEVLTVQMNSLLSDLHRTTYQTFVRVCHAYARWKRTFEKEREQKLLDIQAKVLANKKSPRNKVQRRNLDSEDAQEKSRFGFEHSEEKSGSRENNSRKSLKEQTTQKRRGSVGTKRSSIQARGSQDLGTMD